jgi:hypothetical protein
VEKPKVQEWWMAELNETTQPELVRGFQATIDKYQDNQVLNPFDEVWILKILRHHPSYNQKIGCGIKHLEVRSRETAEGTSRGFWIVRKDNTAEGI